MALIPLPAAALTASVLCDVLAAVAADREAGHRYERAAADILRVGSSASFASIALEITEYLRAPAHEISADWTRRFALDAALLVVYLLDLAARQGRAGDTAAPTSQAQALPTGLSLLGLALLGLSAQRR